MNKTDNIQGLKLLLLVGGKWMEVVLEDETKRQIFSIINKPAGSIKLIKN